MFQVEMTANGTRYEYQIAAESKVDAMREAMKRTASHAAGWFPVLNVLKQIG